MPRVKRKTKRRRAGLTDAHVKQLLTGFDFFGTAFGRRGACDYEAMRAAWESLRDELLPAWIVSHPRTRPFAWWQFDAPERRKRIDDRPHPFDNPERKARIERIAKLADVPACYRESMYRLWFGTPACLCLRDDCNAVFETQREYLKRLGLLTPAEKRQSVNVGCSGEPTLVPLTEEIENEY